MVVKIMDSSPSMRSAMDYNENKVSNGDAIVLHSANADEDLDVRETLKRYERRNRRSIELSFHMSVNPSNTDGMTKEQVKEFVQEVMTGLGLGSQPYIIYQHNDIKREHYHVVSIRTNRNGKKITSRQENRRCLSLINELAIKYGYRVGKEPVQKQRSAQTQAVRFNAEKGNTVSQIESIIKHCCTYRFTSYGQFKFLMRTYGVSVREIREKPIRLVFRGMNDYGKVCTSAIGAGDMSINPVQMFESNSRHWYKKQFVPYEQLETISLICSHYLSVSNSSLDFKRQLLKEGINCNFVRGRDRQITRIIFVDHETKSVLNVSDLRGITLSDFRNAESHGLWEKPAMERTHESILGFATLGDILSSMSSGKSMSRDQRWAPIKKKSKGIKM